MTKDLYATLGVSRTASQDEIRRAYKRKAKELHPDLHPDDEVKLNDFKAVSSAYEVLGDPAKRGKYDRGEIDGAGQPRGFGGHGPSGHPGFNAGHRRAGSGFSGGSQSDAFEDILSGMFGGGRRRPGPRHAARITHRLG